MNYLSKILYWISMFCFDASVSATLMGIFEQTKYRGDYYDVLGLDLWGLGWNTTIFGFVFFSALLTILFFLSSIKSKESHVSPIFYIWHWFSLTGLSFAILYMLWGVFFSDGDWELIASFVFGIPIVIISLIIFFFLYLYKKAALSK